MFVHFTAGGESYGLERLAKEIKAHTMLYLNSLVIQIFVNSQALCLAALWVKSHSNPIDLGGDSGFRLNVYNMLW